MVLERISIHCNGPRSQRYFEKNSDHKGLRLSIREISLILMQRTSYFDKQGSSNKTTSITIVFLMLVSLLASFSSPASASDVVLTDPIEVVQSSAHNDKMMAMDADSGGNVHVVWSRNTIHL